MPSYQITSSRGFPEPVAELAMGNVWHRDDVEEWIRNNRPDDAEPADEAEG